MSFSWGRLGVVFEWDWGVRSLERGFSGCLLVVTVGLFLGPPVWLGFLVRERDPRSVETKRSPGWSTCSRQIPLGAQKGKVRPSGEGEYLLCSLIPNGAPNPPLTTVSVCPCMHEGCGFHPQGTRFQGSPLLWCWGTENAKLFLVFLVWVKGHRLSTAELFPQSWGPTPAVFFLKTLPTSPLAIMVPSVGFLVLWNGTCGGNRSTLSCLDYHPLIPQVLMGFIHLHSVLHINFLWDFFLTRGSARSV